MAGKLQPPTPGTRNAGLADLLILFSFSIPNYTIESRRRAPPKLVEPGSGREDSILAAGASGVPDHSPRLADLPNSIRQVVSQILLPGRALAQIYDGESRAALGSRAPAARMWNRKSTRGSPVTHVSLLQVAESHSLTQSLSQLVCATRSASRTLEPRQKSPVYLEWKSRLEAWQ